MTTSLSAKLGGFLANVTDDMFDVVLDSGPNAEPVVSVVVPTFNRGTMLRDTVEALSQQDTSLPYEVLIVDDASTDDTQALLADVGAGARCRYRVVRLRRHMGPCVARNVGIVLSLGEIVAFTDSDCVPSPSWVMECHSALQELDLIEGRVAPPPWQRQPLFSHFIETTKLDGRFTTANAAYRREYLIASGGFDPSWGYAEDCDVGWRAVRAGARYGFAGSALVYHQVIAVSAAKWLTQPQKFVTWPRVASNYPEFRRFLFLGFWADWSHALLTLGAVGLVLSRWRPPLLALTLPYLVSLPLKRRLRGRWPALKALAHLAYDLVGFASLLAGSIRRRSPVL